MQQNLFQLLEAASTTAAGHTIYPPDSKGSVTRLTYEKLLQTAESDAKKLSQIEGVTSDSILLLHFDKHVDNIRWFWAATAAGLVPAMSPPFTADLERRKRHLNHVHQLLKNPIVLTSEHLVPDFLENDKLQLTTVQSLEDAPVQNSSRVETGAFKDANDTAVLMLTSGSTGNAKAVSLQHGQLISAMQAKSAHHDNTSQDIFLNWIGMDHVAAFSQIHLQAVYLGAEQIHIQATDLLVDPLRFLRLINEHRVSYTFAPNFFMASLSKNLQLEVSDAYDLSCLKVCATGGEANPTETCRRFSELLQKYGAPAGFLSPGFGMTETCAGAIHAKDCPDYDVKKGLDFASLGTPMAGIEMRVVAPDNTPLSGGEIGELQLTGPLVFNKYFNNEQATAEAFTADGWFRTGDRAFIDAESRLNLAGRDKETVIVNGVKYSPTELESVIEETQIPGVTPSYTVVFAYRAPGSDTEGIVVVYVPTFDNTDNEAYSQTSNAIAKASVNLCGVRPYEILAVEKANLPKTSLGKISRSKVRAEFESGAFADLRAWNSKAVQDYRLTQFKAPNTPTEKTIAGLISEMFSMDPLEIGLDASIFDLGIDSIALISFLYQLQHKLGLEDTISLSLALTSPSVGSMAAALDNLEAGVGEYNPVVPLQASGSKTPLWLVHPGVGEILVFLNLAKTFTDRPVYALRARGFNAGDEVFGSLEEVISTYYTHIKKTQPKGPYAIAGYSFGAMLVFEVIKRLEENGDEVKFFGSFNLPPHIKDRMRELDFIEVVSHLSYFLGLMTEEHSVKVGPMLHQYSKQQVLDYIVELAPPKRLAELGLDQTKLEKWASVASALQNLAVDYEPTGVVASIDVFVAIPLAGVAKNKQDWIDNKLSKWKDFSWSEPRIHDVDGAHYTMMGAEHVQSFQKKLKTAIAARGI